ncbi:MAG: hypothetical protein ACYC26_17530, partial [Phycisphaerales bacterium]
HGGHGGGFLVVFYPVFHSVFSVYSVVKSGFAKVQILLTYLTRMGLGDDPSPGTPSPRGTHPKIPHNPSQSFSEHSAKVFPFPRVESP